VLICRNAEGVHAYLSKCWKSNCSSVLMLRGYMVRKSLGTPALEKVIESSPIQFRLCFFLHSHGSVTSGRAAPISACMRRRQRGCFRGLRLLQWQHRAWIVLFHPPSSKLNRSQERFFKSDPTSWNRNQPASFGGTCSAIGAATHSYEFERSVAAKRLREVLYETFNLVAIENRYKRYIQYEWSSYFHQIIDNAKTARTTHFLTSKCHNQFANIFTIDTLCTPVDCFSFNMKLWCRIIKCKHWHQNFCQCRCNFSCTTGITCRKS